MEQQSAISLFSGHCAVTRLHGFVFFGSAHAISRSLDEVAGRLVANSAAVEALKRSAEEEQDRNVASSEIPAASSGGAPGATQSASALTEEMKKLVLLEGPKRTQVYEALHAAPRFLVLDFTAARGLDATGARTFGVLCRDLLALGVIPLLSCSEHDGIASLLSAHGVDAARVKWPPEVRDAAGIAGWAEAAGSHVASQNERCAEEEAEEAVLRLPHLAWTQLPPELTHAYAAGARPLAFEDLRSALRFAEDQFVATAVRYGLCRPPMARFSLAELVDSHLQEVHYFIHVVDSID